MWKPAMSLTFMDIPKEIADMGKAFLHVERRSKRQVSISNNLKWIWCLWTCLRNCLFSCQQCQWCRCQHWQLLCSEIQRWHPCIFVDMTTSVSCQHTLALCELISWIILRDMENMLWRFLASMYKRGISKSHSGSTNIFAKRQTFT